MYIFTQGFVLLLNLSFSITRNIMIQRKYIRMFCFILPDSCLMIFLGDMYFLDVLKYFLGSEYFSGLTILPWVLMANLFQGIYYSLSLWYKLTDRTIYGAYMAVIGCVITIGGNVIFLPKVGFMASAYSVFTCFLVMTILSFVLGRHFYKINYDVPKIIFYFVICLLFYFVGGYIKLIVVW